jgi:hypothetical protein
MIAIPGTLGYIAYKTDVCLRSYSLEMKRMLIDDLEQGKYEFRGKRRGDAILEY